MKTAVLCTMSFLFLVSCETSRTARDLSDLTHGNILSYSGGKLDSQVGRLASKAARKAVILSESLVSSLESAAARRVSTANSPGGGSESCAWVVSQAIRSTTNDPSVSVTASTTVLNADLARSENYVEVSFSEIARGDIAVTPGVHTMVWAGDEFVGNSTSKKRVAKYYSLKDWLSDFGRPRVYRRRS